MHRLLLRQFLFHIQCLLGHQHAFVIGRHDLHKLFQHFRPTAEDLLCDCRTGVDQMLFDHFAQFGNVLFRLDRFERNRYFHGKAQWLDDVMPIISMVAITVIIAVITAAGQQSLLTVGPLLVAAAVVHNAAGYLFGYWGCRLLGMDEVDCRTISIEVGMQNGGLASGIAMQMGKVATVGLAPAIFGPWMNITGSGLANYWRRKVLETEPDDEVEAPAGTTSPAAAE